MHSIEPNKEWLHHIENAFDGHGNCLVTLSSLVLLNHTPNKDNNKVKRTSCNSQYTSHSSSMLEVKLLLPVTTRGLWMTASLSVFTHKELVSYYSGYHNSGSTEPISYSLLGLMGMRMMGMRMKCVH